MNTCTQTSGPPKIDFNQSPFLILWELTRACELACRHCRASAIEYRDPSELSTGEACKLLGDLKEFGRPLIVLTGGNPARRPDLFEIIEEARRNGFKVAITPSATPLMTEQLVQRLKQSGVSRIAISLDGPDEISHDFFRGVRGSFEWSKDIIRWANDNEIAVQINSTMWRDNFSRFDELSEVVAQCKAVLWSVFFLVTTGRATRDMQLSADEAESVLQKMALLCRDSFFDVKSTAAPQFRRVLIEKYCRSMEDRESPPLMDMGSNMKVGALRSYQSVNDGKGLMFISATGEVFPSGFLPISAGNVRTDSLVTVYRDSEMFRSLRNPANLNGKCGRCKFKAVCGGSRARAYAESGDYLAEDKLCPYIPAA